MAYYRICERCGARLDPGEPCGCEYEEMKEYMVRYLDFNSDIPALWRQEARSENEAKRRFLKCHRRCRIIDVTKITAPVYVC